MDLTLSFPWNQNDDPQTLMEREWLLTNGLGGYASGSVLGVPTRHYHGLFVPNLAEPKGRYVMISRCDEEFDVDGRTVRLGGVEDATGLMTDAHRHLMQFRLENHIAIWVYEIAGRLLEKSVVMPHNQNTVCVQYRLLSGEPLPMRLRPFVSFRRHDADAAPQGPPPFKLSVAHGRHEISLANFPAALRMAMHPAHTPFVTRETEYRNPIFRTERERGYEHRDYGFSPGYFVATLTTQAPAYFCATTQRWETLDVEVGAVFAGERERIRRLIARAPAPLRAGLPAHLVAAADQFIVLPASRLDEAVVSEAAGDELRTVIAGYHWFGDWGRDTMIGLEGLTLCTGRQREARAILLTFARYVRDGLLPNLFPEGEREALYHTIDATLWYFHALERYRQASGDDDILQELWPTLGSIVTHYIRGTRFGIGEDPKDNLIRGGAPGYQLTWMDAKVGDWVVTPRRGKPVEIQALWYNALCLMAQWAGILGTKTDHVQAALHVRRCFNERYWDPARGHLLDVVDGEHGDDPSLRPNQIFALSLDHPVLEQKYWRAVLERVQKQLLTPFGLRTLSPDHPDYKRNYQGDLRSRDAAYHQGTVWPWLIGHFIDAWLRVHPDRATARRLLLSFEQHLHTAGLGSISEIFDAEAPYTPRGCIAQAWSVAEVLRAWLKTASDSA